MDKRQVTDKSETDWRYFGDRFETGKSYRQITDKLQTDWRQIGEGLETD